MIKICYVVTVPQTIRSFFIPQLKYLADNGFDVSVICSLDDTIKNELGESVKYIPVDIPRGISLFGSLRAVKELKRIFAKERFDIIQYSTPNAALYAAVAAKQAGCKARNYHLMGLRYLGAAGLGRRVLKTLEKITCHYSTSIECVSRSNMELGIRAGLFPPEKVTVVWNGSTGGVDLNRFDFAKRQQWRREVREKLGYSDEDFVYGFVGRITGDKGVNELLEAHFRLNGDAKLLLVGSMESVRTLDKALINRAKSDPTVQFHDVVSDVERYYAAIDVLVLPSYREGFGNVVIEAAAVGTPAIVSDIPGPTDAIERNKTALVVPAKDVLALSETMRRIRTMDVAEMGRNAVEYSATHFDSDELCKKITERKKLLLGLR